MDSFTAALEQLDPASRALLDLSLRRGMRPEEIGDLLGTDPESVIVAREQALEQLTSDLDTETDSAHEGLRTRLAELPAAAWIAQPDAAETEQRAPLKLVTEQEAAPRPRPERVRPAPQRRPPAKRRRSRMPLLLVLLAAAAVALVVALSSGGDGDQASSTPSAGPNAPAPAPKPAKPSQPAKGAKPSKPAGAGQKVKLTSVNGAPKGVTGSAALVNGGKRLRLDVRGLPAASYEVWLFDSVIDARSLGRTNGTRVSLDAKLPKDASHYGFVDVSREPTDGNPNHSGDSVLRVKLSKLAR